MATMTRLPERSPWLVRTPVTRPSSTASASTRSRRISTRPVRRYRSRARTTSADLSLTGNTRLPRSTFSGQPCASKKSMAARGGKASRQL